MSIRASVTFECDSKGCHAELVFDGTDANVLTRRGGLDAQFFAYGWVMDDDDLLHCPACCEERDEAYERAAARARNNDFADTGGKDWT